VSSTPTTDNQAIDTIDGFVQAAITGGEAVAGAYLKAAVPWLYLPVVSIITNWIVSYIASAVYTQTTNLVAMAVIDIQTKLETSAVGSAVTQLKAAQASGDANALANATNAYNQAAANLVMWDGSGTAPAL